MNPEFRSIFKVFVLLLLLQKSVFISEICLVEKRFAFEVTLDTIDCIQKMEIMEAKRPGRQLGSGHPHNYLQWICSPWWSNDLWVFYD